LYICLCNALTVRQVEQAVQAGARRPKEVYAAAGAKAECGNCTGTVLCVLRKLLANDDVANDDVAQDDVAQEGRDAAD
jgi:bacterioferritin-associated ferredoxin